MGRLFIAMLALLWACQSPPTPPADDPGAETAPQADSPTLHPAYPRQPGCPVPEELPGMVRFGLTPYVDQAMLEEYFGPIAEYLSQEIGRPVELVVAETYEDLVEMLVRGEVDLVSISPLIYVEARERLPCMQLLLTQVAGGSPYYSGYLLVRADSPISEVNDLAGRRFAFTSRQSASGYLFPKAFFLRRGLPLEGFLGPIRYAPDHTAALRLLLDGEVDGIATFSTFLKAARGAGLTVGNLRVLAVTGRIPYDAVCARPGLAPAIVLPVTEALSRLNSTTESGRRLLGSSLGINGWIPTDDSVYEPVRDCMKQIDKGTR